MPLAFPMLAMSLAPKNAIENKAKTGVTASHNPNHETKSKLATERSLDIVHPPVQFHLTGVDILSNPGRPLVHISIFSFTFAEHLGYKVSRDTRIIGVAEVFVNTLLERFYALPQFLCIVRVHQFLENGTGMR